MASQNAPQRQRAIQKQVARADEIHPKAEAERATFALMSAATVGMLFPGKPDGR